MKFGVLDPFDRSARIIDLPDFKDALSAAGLTPDAIDHGTVAPGLSIAVSEYGLFLPPERQAYFVIAGYRHLCAGRCVLYAYKPGPGVTVDLVQLPRIIWLPDRRAVERAIAEGVINRPHMGIGDDVIWRWPGPRPSAAERQRLMSKEIGATMIIDDTAIIAVPPSEKKP